MADTDDEIARMKVVQPQPVEWQVICPTCETAIDMQMTADDYGAHVPDGHDVALRCSDCDTLFGVGAVSVVEAYPMQGGKDT